MANENKKGPKAVKPYLSDLRDLSPEERRAFASKGGKASGKARQDKKTMKEILNALLDSKPSKQRLKDVKKKYPGIDISNLTYRGIVGLAMLEKAVGAEEFVKADVSAAQWVRDTAGEKPVDKQATTDSNGNDIIAPIKLEIVPVEVVHDKTSETS